MTNFKDPLVYKLNNLVGAEMRAQSRMKARAERRREQLDLLVAENQEQMHRVQRQRDTLELRRTARQEELQGELLECFRAAEKRRNAHMEKTLEKQ